MPYPFLPQFKKLYKGFICGDNTDFSVVLRSTSVGIGGWDFIRRSHVCDDKAESGYLSPVLRFSYYRLQYYVYYVNQSITEIRALHLRIRICCVPNPKSQIESSPNLKEIFLYFFSYYLNGVQWHPNLNHIQIQTWFFVVIVSFRFGHPNPKQVVVVVVSFGFGQPFRLPIMA